MGRKTWSLAPIAEDGSLASYVSQYDVKAGKSWREFFPVIAEEEGEDRGSEGWVERHYKTVTMTEPEPFEAELRVLTMHRGRSAAHLIWMSRSGGVFPMFMTDIVDTLRRVELMDGWTEPRTWDVVKRGSNYGIRLVDEP